MKHIDLNISFVKGTILVISLYILYCTHYYENVIKFKLDFFDNFFTVQEINERVILKCTLMTIIYNIN